VWCHESHREKKAIVKTWGNSASVRSPATVMAAARLRLNRPVDIREEEGRIVIEPIRPKRYNIGEMVASITDENLHDPIDAGPPQGREVW
jgi:antitoxin MazE